MAEQKKKKKQQSGKGKTSKNVASPSGQRNKAVEPRKKRNSTREISEHDVMCHAVIEAAVDGFWLADRKGKILEVNDAYIRRSGYSRQDLLSMHIEDLDATGRCTETLAHFERALRGGSCLFDTLHRAKDGTVWQVEATISYRQIKGGRFFAFFRDIIRRKRSEALLRTRLKLSELAESGTIDDLLRYALDAAELHTGSSIGFFHFVDDDQEKLTLQTWSSNTLKNMCTAAGKGTHYPISKAGVWVECIAARKPVIHNDYAALKQRKGLPEGHAPVVRELVVPVLSNGKIVAVNGVGNKTSDYVQDDVEVVQKISSLVMDLVFRKRAEDALRSAEQKYRSLIETTDTGYVIIDDTGRVTDTNDKYASLSGRSRSEIIGHNVLEWTAPHDRERNAAEVSKCVEQGEVRNLEIDYVDRAENITPIEINATLLRTGDSRSILSLCRDITDRKKAQQQIAERGALLRQTMDTVNVGIALVNRVGRVTLANRRMAEIFGYSQEELLEMEYRDFVHPAEREAATQRMHRLLTGEVTSSVVERRYIRKDGTELWGRLTTNRFWDSQGNDLGFIGAITDVSDLKRIEEKLRVSESKYRRLVSEMLYGFALHEVVFDAAGRPTDYVTLEVNSAFESLLNVKAEDIIGKKVSEILPKDEFLKWLEIFGNVAVTGNSAHYEMSSPFNLRHFEGTAYSSEKGKFAVIFSDVTERRLAEDALKESEARLHTILNNVGAFIFLKDTSYRYTYVNRKVSELFGLKPEEIMGRGDESFFDAESVAEVRKSDEPVIMRGETIIREEDRLVGADGVYRTFWVTKLPLFDQAGEVIGLCGISTDITELKRAQIEREQYFNLFQNASDFMVIADPNGAFKKVNPACVQTLGYSSEELTAKPFVDFVHPDDKQPTLDEMARQLQKGFSLNFENRYVCKDGTFRWLSWRATYDNQEGMTYATARDITELKKAETEREQFFRFFNTSNDMMCVAGTDGYFKILNSAWTFVLGYELAELLLQPFTHFIHPDDVAPTEVEMEKLAEGISSVNFINRYLCKDGSFRWLEWKATLGEENVIYGIARDITQRTLAQEALQESEETYRVLFDQDPLPGWIYDAETLRFLLVNRAALAHYGYAEEEFYSMTIKDIRPSEDVDKLLSYSAQIAHKPSMSTYWKHKKKDGTFINVEIHSHPMKFIGKQARRVIVKDITERKIAEEKLRQSEQFTRSILDTVDEGFIVIDRDYRIVTANKAYSRQIGISCDEAIGKHCYEVSHGITRPCYEEGEDCAVRQVFATGQAHTALHKHPDRNGHFLYVETKGFPIKDDTGQVVSVIETINNITEKHLLEEERLKTQKLESIGTLAGGIAHDFNNLLQGVFGYISLAKLKKDDREKSFAALEQAEKALHQSVNLTSQLLTFSKGGKPVRRRIALQPVIENAVKFALSGSRTDYRFAIDPDLWQVDGDAGQLAQVIQNIVLNADQAMPVGGSVVITARNVSHTDPQTGLTAGDYIEIRIEDTGIGIPEQYLDKIFDPYFTTKEKGSGLGLATSYSIVRNHNGHIRVASDIGKGSVFSLFLPAVVIRSGADAAMERPLPVNSPRLRILVMDDEDVIRTLAEEMLRALGHDVEVAAHGEDALKKYRLAADAGKPFNAVILDHTIRGGMGGAETIKRLKDIDPGVKAVVSSGYSDNDAVMNYRKNGFKAFLKKPYDIEELKKILQDVAL